jgi:hypothetical protein
MDDVGRARGHLHRRRRDTEHVLGGNAHVHAVRIPVKEIQPTASHGDVRGEDARVAPKLDLTDGLSFDRPRRGQSQDQNRRRAHPSMIRPPGWEYDRGSTEDPPWRSERARPGPA